MVAPEAAVPTGLPLNPANGQFSDPSRSVLVDLSLSLSLFKIFSLTVSLEQQHKDVSHFWFIFFPPAFNPDLNPDLEERREKKTQHFPFLSSFNFLPSPSSFIEPKPRSLFLATFPARHELIPKTFPSFSLYSSALSLSLKLLVFLHLLPLFSFNDTIINPQFHSNDFTRLYDQLPFQF